MAIGFQYKDAFGKSHSGKATSASSLMHSAHMMGLPSQRQNLKVDTRGSIENGIMGLRLKGENGMARAKSFYGVSARGGRGFVTLDDIDPKDGAAVSAGTARSSLQIEGNETQGGDSPFGASFLSGIYLDVNSAGDKTLHAFSRGISFTAAGRAIKVGGENSFQVGTWRDPWRFGGFAFDPAERRIYGGAVMIKGNPVSVGGMKVPDIGDYGFVVHINTKSSSAVLEQKDAVFYSKIPIPKKDPAEPQEYEVFIPVYKIQDGVVVDDYRGAIDIWPGGAGGTGEIVVTGTDNVSVTGSNLIFKSAADANVEVICRQGDDGEVTATVGVYWL